MDSEYSVVDEIKQKLKGYLDHPETFTQKTLNDIFAQLDTLGGQSEDDSEEDGVDMEEMDDGEEMADDHEVSSGQDKKNPFPEIMVLIGKKMEKMKK